MIKMLALLTGVTSAAAVPQLDIAPERVTVSGVSSGGHMAHQLHVGYSDLFSGVGIVAGGPWGCAGGDLNLALGRCMGNPAADPPVDALHAQIREAAAEGRIAPIANLKDDPVWLFRGTLDAMVAAPVADALAELYRRLSDRVTYVDDFEAAHHFPTLDAGSACDASAAPFLGDCDYDAAGKLLTHLYGELEAPGQAPDGELTALPVPGADAAHLMEQAWVYVPAVCADGASDCALHVVLHGCAQSARTIDTTFIEDSGYRRWADANGIVLLYPQVKPSQANPYGCWDWWGYSGESYLDRDAPQMKAVVDLVRGLMGQAIGEDTTAWRRADPKNLVYLDLPEGRVLIELAPQLAPINVAQFKRLVQEGFYDGLTFYRVIDGFVAQGGTGEDGEEDEGPADTLPAEFERAWSEDMPFVPAQKPDLFAPETGFIGGFPAARDAEAGRVWLTHCPATVAMARDKDPDSATTEFYIVIGQAPRYLDRNLTVIGRVIDGMPVVQRIRRGPSDQNGIIENPEERTPIVRMRMAADLPTEERVAIEVVDTNSSQFAETLASRRNRDHPFFHHKPPEVLDVCQVPIATRKP